MTSRDQDVRLRNTLKPRGLGHSAFDRPHAIVC